MSIVSAIISVASFDIPFVDADTFTRPFFGPILEPPFEDSVLTDYPEDTGNFIDQMD